MAGDPVTDQGSGEWPHVDRRKKKRGWSIIALASTTLGIAAFLIAVTFGVLVFQSLTLRDNTTKTANGANLLLTSSRVERALIDIETGIRGAFLTDNEALLAPFREGLGALKAENQADLDQYVDSDIERAQAAGLESGIRRYVQDFALPAAAQVGTLTRDQERTLILQGKTLLDNLRGGFDELNSFQEVELAAQRQKTEDVAHRSILVSTAGLVGSLLLLAVVGWYLLTRILRPIRAVARGARRLADGQLETRVPEGGRGEVGALAHSFNRMAFSLQDRNRELLETNRKLEGSIETVEEASRLKSAFLANMSHEIRTPLNGVMGMTALLNRTELDPEQREYVRTARASGDALMTVINDILDFSKIEAGRLEVDPHDFDLPQAIDATCDVVASAAQAKDLQLHVFIETDVPRTVNGDRGRTMQILTNLLTNAIKFTSEGEIKVDVTRGELSAMGSHIKMCVRDTGIGIEPEALKTLFDAFTQADVSTTRKFGGSGLGLAISFELARLMGGSITVESEPGTGSTFTLELPFGEPMGETERPAARAELRGLKVLIADPDKTGRGILDSYTTAWGMRAETAADAGTAMDLLHDAAVSGSPFDLILLDAELDTSSSGTVSERIAASPSLRAMKTIKLTASRTQAAQESDEEGVTYLPKPISQSRLLDTIASAIHGDSETTARSASLNSWTPGTGRILMAEDNEINQFFLSEVLAGKGYSFEIANNGAEALEKLQNDGTFDLVLMDCQMPELDGYDATRKLRIREVDENLPHMPVIAMTAHAMEGDREKCIAAGMDDYLAKPLQVEELDRVLGEWLGGDADPAEA
ncbi:MAG: response regulator [Solirubrobacterales bacterium]